MSATRAQLELVMRVSRQLVERGQGDLAVALMSGFEGAEGHWQATEEPNPGPLSAVERKRLRDKEYAARRRLVVKKSSLVVSESSDESSATSSKVVSDSRAIAPVSESENSGHSGSNSGEIETSSLPESSQFRARGETTNRRKSSDESFAESSTTTSSPSVAQPALRALSRLQMAFGQTWDFQSFQRQLALIAAKPEAEFEKVLANLPRDEWARANRGAVTPQHVLKEWNRYVDPPSKPRPKHAPTPVTSVERHREDAKSTVFDAAG